MTFYVSELYSQPYTDAEKVKMEDFWMFSLNCPVTKIRDIWYLMDTQHPFLDRSKYSTDGQFCRVGHKPSISAR